MRQKRFLINRNTSFSDLGRGNLTSIIETVVDGLAVEQEAMGGGTTSTAALNGLN